MKETAREINEAVALGKETEAGINEVRGDSNVVFPAAPESARHDRASCVASTGGGNKTNRGREQNRQGVGTAKINYLSHCLAD